MIIVNEKVAVSKDRLVDEKYIINKKLAPLFRRTSILPVVDENWHYQRKKGADRETMLY
jgi:hypothetical protein